MHLFRAKEKPGQFRGFARFELPDNPICWLFGHRPRVEVRDHRGIGSWVQVECRTCNRRFVEDPDTLVGLTKEATDWKALRARRAEVARRDPTAYAANIPRRRGWHANEAGANLEAYWRGLQRPARFLDALGFKVHIGHTGSESPYHLYLGVGVAEVYTSLIANGRLGEWIGRGHKRDVGVTFHGGKVWWKLWYDGEAGNDEHHRCDPWRRPKLWPWSKMRRKYRPWMCLRNGSLDVNPADALWGSPKYLRTRAAGPLHGMVCVDDFPGDHYLVEFMLEQFEVRREHGPAWARRVLRSGFAYEAKCTPGIPVRNHDWKGDEILGWGGNLPDVTVDDWLTAAVEHTVRQVRADRRRYGYVPKRVEA